MPKVIVERIKFEQITTIELPEGDTRNYMITTDDFPVKNSSGATRDEALANFCLELFLHLYNKMNKQTSGNVGGIVV